MKEKELKFLISQGEGYNIEFKENISGIDKDIVAFANSSGGRIFLGISDKGEVRGINITNRLKSQIIDLARNCDPTIKVNLESLKYAGKSVLIVNVPEGEDKPYQCRHGFFLRVGSNSQKLKRDEILNFILEVNKRTFDTLINREFDFDRDFDNEKFSKYLEMAGISPVLNAKEMLASLGVLKNGKATNACVLLFAKNPQKFFPQSVYTAVVYRDKEGTEVIKREEISGSLFEIVGKVMDFVRFYTKVAYKFTGKPRREEIYEYPLEAIREAVINSVMHKYYPESGHNNLLAIYPDRIEIENYWIKPKGFVLGKTKFRRNPLIVDLFLRIGLGEKIGSGIARMQKICKKENAPEPEIKALERYFYITFRPSYAYMKFVEASPLKTPQKTPQKILTGLESRILNEIIGNPRISGREIAENLGIGLDTVKEYLERLKKKNLIRRIGPKKGGYWEVLDSK